MKWAYLFMWAIAASFYFLTGTTQWCIAMWALAILSYLEYGFRRLRNELTP